MSFKDAVKDFFAKGRGVLLGFSLILLGALLITVHKILASITVLIGIILLTLSDYISESEDEEFTSNEEDEDELDKGEVS